MKLWQVAKLIRSKNAGPFELTFDVILKDRKTYEKVRDAKVINAEWFARTYRLKPEVVAIINYDAASAIKITIPRPTISGDIDDTDVFGGILPRPGRVDDRDDLERRVTQHSDRGLRGGARELAFGEDRDLHRPPTSGP